MLTVDKTLAQWDAPLISKIYEQQLWVRLCASDSDKDFNNV